MSTDAGRSADEPTVGRAFLAQNAAAREEGAACLRALGYSQGAGEQWEGAFTLEPPQGQAGQAKVVAVTVRLPPAFPTCLPKVSVRLSDLPGRIAHVENSGNICIAPSNGLSVDITRPREVVQEALDRARDLILRGLKGQTTDDLAREFLAYWDARHSDLIWSICDSRGQSRPLFAGRVQRADRSERMLLADSRGEAVQWTGRLGWRFLDQRARAYLLGLDRPILPPDLGDSPTLGDWLRIFQNNSETAEWEFFQAWLGRITFPGLLVVSFPTPDSSIPTLIAVHLPRLSDADTKAARRGFRRDSVTGHRQLTFARRYPLDREAPRRLDAAFLRERGGGVPLDGKHVTLVGCGSVGGFLAFNLASLGVPRLTIVDPDLMGGENVHRHLLGVADIGAFKALGVATYLNKHFPHQVVEARTNRLEEIIQSEPRLLDTDLLVIALGEETLERQLNQSLGCRVPRLHTWLEPLGVGGHTLLTGRPTDVGCYECLFENGPRNDASLCAPGQTFNRTLAGCAGLHSPFSSLDAIRTASEAARIAVSALRGEEPNAVLLSWRGCVGEFERQGYALSPRGLRIPAGSVSRLDTFGRTGCPVCSLWHQ